MNKRIKKTLCRVAALTMCAALTLGFASSYAEVKDEPVERVAGADRYETNLLASKDIFKSSDTVIIASGENYPDSLCGGPLAYYLNAPILFVKNTLTHQTKDEIKRLGAKDAIILGGDNSVNKDIEKDLAKSLKVTRLAGNDRIATSIAIARYCIEKYDIKSVAVASSTNFADSLAGIPFVVKNKGILVLQGKGDLNTEIEKLCANRTPFIIGGVNSVGENIEQKLKARRIAGKDRVETSIKLAEEYDKNSEAIIIVDGKNYPDALSAGFMIRSLHAPIIYAYNDGTESKIKDFKDVKKVVVLGGESSVSDSQAQNVVKDLGLKDKNQDKPKEEKPIVYPGTGSGSGSGSSSVDKSKLVVDIPDKQLKKVINFWIDPSREADADITRGEMASLKKIDVDAEVDGTTKAIIPIGTDPQTYPKVEKRFTRGIKSMEGLQYAKNLEYLDLSENDISDLKPISRLMKLKHLELDRNLIKDLRPIRGLTEMEHLNLYNNLISNINPLKNMTKLTFLDVHFNTQLDGTGGVKNIDAVKNMTELVKLDVCSNPALSDISAMENLHNLKIIDCSGCSIRDFTLIVKIAPEILHENLDKGNGDTSLGFTAQTIKIGDVNVDAKTTTVKIPNPYKGIDKIYQGYAKLNDPSLDTSQPLNPFMPSGMEMNPSDLEGVTFEGYDLDSNSFIVTIPANTTNEPKEYKLNKLTVYDSFYLQWNLKDVTIKQAAAPNDI